MKESLRFIYAYQEEERTNPDNGKTFFSGYWVKIKECQSFKHALDEATRLQAESVEQGKPISHCVNSPHHRPRSRNYSNRKETAWK